MNAATATVTAAARGRCAYLLIPGAMLLLAGCVDDQVRDSARASPEWLRAQHGLVSEDFAGSQPPTPMCHASTIAEDADDLVVAWFGGAYEGQHEVAIWSSRQSHDGSWSDPVAIETGTVSTGERYACWNPVLFKPVHGPLLLFYKVGNSPRSWWGMMASSSDGGRTWGQAQRLPAGILGPIKDKPIQLEDGTLLCPSSTEEAGLRVFNQGWRMFIERTRDLGQTWQSVGPLNDPREVDCIQPTLCRHADGRLQLLARSRSGRIMQAWSGDGGLTWGAVTPTALPNPNSGIDAVSLRDGRQLLVYNHCTAGRDQLEVAVSEDGTHWLSALVLEDQPGEYSYPAVIQSSDGLVHITYSWRRRRIRHVVVDPARLVLHEIPEGRWNQAGW